MGEVRVKTGKPQPTEFSRDDVVIDTRNLEYIKKI